VQNISFFYPFLSLTEKFTRKKNMKNFIVHFSAEKKAQKKRFSELDVLPYLD
jgi:hypothetical protein